MDSPGFCDSGIVVAEDSDNRYSDRTPEYGSGKTSPSFVCIADLLHTRIPIATWRLAELEFFSTKIPIAKWRLQEFYMEKKSKMYRGTATSFGFKRPISATPTLVSAPPHEQLTNSIESEIITTATRTGTPRLSRPRKETTAAVVKTNRFGFRSPTVLSNKVADSQNDINSTKANLRLDGLEETTKPSLLPQPRSHLPRLQQFPVRLAAPAHYHPRTASADKSAKTAANNHTARRSRSENGGSSASSVNDADSGVGSQKSGGELDMIEQLECSPSARNRLRNIQKSRPMKMIFTGGNEKKFELRDLKDSIEVTEIVPLELPALRLPQDCGLVRDRAKAYGRQLSRDTHSHSGSSEDDEGIEDEAGEEKLHRDRVLSEKDERGVVGAGEEAAEGEELWGHGEAMAGEEDMYGGQDMDSDRDSDGSPGSPGTPTHMSNSLSLSSDIRDRDFIDDEICDQPGLVYGDLTAGNSSGNTLVADERDASPRVSKPLSALGHLTVDCSSARHSSVGTLSPCESITSDDLIMDFDLSAVDDDHRLDTSSLEAALTDGEGDGEEVLQELNSLLAARPDVLEGTWLMNGVRATRQLRPRVGSSGSGADSPRSLDTPRLRSGSALSSPLRSRQSTSSPGDDISEDSGIRVNRVTYQSMYQDVINIKALLLRLNRVMQESEADNPNGTSQKNGFCGCSGDTNGDVSQQELIADLQRQVVFLQSQVEERDRTIRSLQTTQPPEPREKVETCNAATQTDRVRPLSTGPIMSTQPDAAGGSFVSNTNESVRQHVPSQRPISRLPQLRRATSPSCDLHKSLRKQT